MSSVMVFPDTRDCLRDLIHNTQHVGETVRAQYHLQSTPQGGLAGPLPVVHLQLTQGGTEGFLDRADRLTLACYARAGSKSLDVLESVRASIIGWGIETPSGYLDSVRVINSPAPTDSAFNSDNVDRAVMTVEVVTRPI